MDTEQQAEAFLDYHRRTGGDLDADFRRWSSSKRLSPRQRAQVRRIVDEHQLASGDAVVTDLAAWEGICDSVDRAARWH